MARIPNPIVQRERLRLICQFLSNGGGTIDDMTDFVNRDMTSNGHQAVKLRTIQYDLERLKSGEFEHSKSDLPRRELKTLFKYKTSGKYYSWDENSEVPLFDDLEESERMTLPFLFGILKKYEGLPAIQKILDTIDEKYHITPAEFESAGAFFVQSPVMANERFEKRLIQLVLQLIAHIQRNEVVEFHYAIVGNLDETMNTYSSHRIAPIYVRLYENYYYLTGIDLTKERIANYRMDQIKRFTVEVSLDENEEIEIFDRKKLMKQYRVEQHFKNVLGVWNHHTTDELHRVTIEFRDWAASYVKRLKFHPSQKLVSEDVANKTYTISMDLLMFPEIVKGKKVHERSPELAFLLGRFRECARIISMIKI
jgi:hypothetical protein